MMTSNDSIIPDSYAETNAATIKNQSQSSFESTVRGVIMRVTYRNQENNYSVVQCSVKDEREAVTMVGYCLNFSVGTEIIAEGRFIEHKKYCGKFIEKFNAGIGKVMDIELDVYKSSGSIESAESIKAFDVTLLRAICHYMILKNSEIGENRLLYFSRELQLVDWKAALILCPSS